MAKNEKDKIEFRGTKIELIEQATRNPLGILRLFGVWFTNELRKAFRTQGARDSGGQSRRLSVRGVPPARPWEPRRVPNFPAGMRDLDGAASVKKRRYDAQPALIDTGRLRDSIAFRHIGRDKIEVGTVVPYAQLHQDGGVSSVTMTKKIRDNLAKYLKRNPDKRKEWGWLFQYKPGERVEFRVRSRPFITFGDKDLAKLHDLLYRHLKTL